MEIELRKNGATILTGTEDELLLLRSAIRYAIRKGRARCVLLEDDGVSPFHVVCETTEAPD
jgi:hypothetical protein